MLAEGYSTVLTGHSEVAWIYRVGNYSGGSNPNDFAILDHLTLDKRLPHFCNESQVHKDLVYAL